MSSRLFLSCIPVAVLLAGCANMATTPGTGSTRNSLIAVAYGTVENVQQVAMKPDYGAGALIGGVLGLAAASGYSTGSQALGAREVHGARHHPGEAFDDDL